MLPLYYTSLNVAPSYGYLNDNNLWGRAGKGGGGVSGMWSGKRNRSCNMLMDFNYLFIYIDFGNYLYKDHFADITSIVRSARVTSHNNTWETRHLILQQNCRFLHFYTFYEPNLRLADRPVKSQTRTAE